MARKYYNKLVRDNVPRIIRKSDKVCGTKTVHDSVVFFELLVEKAQEELDELKEAVKTGNKNKITEEVVDLHEVVEWLALTQGQSYEEYSERKLRKSYCNGSYYQRQFLEYTEDTDES